MFHVAMVICDSLSARADFLVVPRNYSLPNAAGNEHSIDGDALVYLKQDINSKSAALKIARKVCAGATALDGR